MSIACDWGLGKPLNEKINAARQEFKRDSERYSKRRPSLKGRRRGKSRRKLLRRHYYVQNVSKQTNYGVRNKENKRRKSSGERREYGAYKSNYKRNEDDKDWRELRKRRELKLTGKKPRNEGTPLRTMVNHRMNYPDQAKTTTSNPQNRTR